MAVHANDTDQGATKEIRVLEFGLNDQRYCVEIEHIAEIVDEQKLTTIPDSARHVVGIMNLRDQTTTIVDPKIIFGIETQDTDHRVVIFDSDADVQTGWLVDAVYQVRTFTHSDIHDGDDVEGISSEGEAINGIIHVDEDFVLWVDPTTINDT